MRIALVAPPLESVPPEGYGGTERVVATLANQLVRRGHHVTLFASGDSHTLADLVPTVDRALWHHEIPFANYLPFWAVTLGLLTERLADFDVVHAHVDYWGFAVARLAPCPVVTTLHGRLDLPELLPVYRVFADVPLVSISNAQRAPVAFANWVATVYHGVEFDGLTYNATPEPYFAFIGRVAQQKGLDIAIRVAERAGVLIKVAARMPLPGPRDPEAREDRRYFAETIEPLLAGRGVEFLGELGGAEKDAFLHRATALLFPVTWPEPFGLAMVEALACGTPVLALRQGSVPEIVRHGLTGFIGDTEDDLVDAVGRVGTLDRAACRADAELRFSPDVMAEQYERVYGNLLSARNA